MGRKKLNRFREQKMMAARVETSDYLKFEFMLNNKDGKNLQEAINGFIVSYISGNLTFSGSQIVGKQ